MRPKIELRPRKGVRLRSSTSGGGVLYAAERQNTSPSRRYILPKFASQMRTAFVSIAWNTGSRSPGELEMTCKTSEVAVCCSSASLRSSVR